LLDDDWVGQAVRIVMHTIDSGAGNNITTSEPIRILHSQTILMQHMLVVDSLFMQAAPRFAFINSKAGEQLGIGMSHRGGCG